MPVVKERDAIIDQLQNQISDETGNMHEDNLEQITDQFNDILNDALRNFNSDTFDKDGFVQKLRSLDLDSNDKDVVKNVLNNIKSDYITMDAINQSEILLKRDLKNITDQMSEMQDVIKVTRDAIVEGNTSTGEIARTLIFKNHEDNESYTSLVEEIEERHNLKMSTKNFIVPNTLQNGEYYVHVVPYAKLFAELEMIHDSKFQRAGSLDSTVFHESIPYEVAQSFNETRSLYTEENLTVLVESVSYGTKVDAVDDAKIESNDFAKNVKRDKEFDRSNLKTILENIEVANGASELVSEYGYEGTKEFVFKEYNEYLKRVAKQNKGKSSVSEDQHFMEAMGLAQGNNIFKNIDQDDVDVTHYKHIKGCYMKFLNPLKMVPVRIDRRIIGYYYATTTMDLQTTQVKPNGMLDLSYQHYTRDKNLVDQLASIIIRSFDKRMIDKNIKLKGEIAEIIMAHKFAEGKLTFIYIPEDEVIRFAVNEDEDGKGHSILEPTIYPARNYIMLNTYNMLYTLNNNTTRIHYLKSSGLNKDYAAQVQRTMRKFQSRRITIDDIYSYQGVLNKIGGMGEMVLPEGRNGFKALETDTIEAVNNPINTEFIEQQRRNALAGTGVPYLLVINAIDEVDFAKTLEMANTRFNSTAASYKIDIADGLTKLYKMLMQWETDLENDIVDSFRYKFDAVKQQELNITADMIQNFNALVEIVMSIYYTKSDMEDEKGNPSSKQIFLRKELAKEYLPQLDFDRLDDLVSRVNVQAVDKDLQDKVSELAIKEEDIKEITNDE